VKPPISAGDVVHAAGAPAMVERLAIQARTAGAVLHADPFTPSPPEPDGLLTRASQRLGGLGRSLLARDRLVAPQPASRAR
jgi:hypothetical protein